MKNYIYKFILLTIGSSMTMELDVNSKSSNKEIFYKIINKRLKEKGVISIDLYLEKFGEKELEKLFDIISEEILVVNILKQFKS